MISYNDITKLLIISLQIPIIWVIRSSVANFGAKEASYIISIFWDINNYFVLSLSGVTLYRHRSIIYTHRDWFYWIFWLLECDLNLELAACEVAVHFRDRASSTFPSIALVNIICWRNVIPDNNNTIWVFVWLRIMVIYVMQVNRMIARNRILLLFPVSLGPSDVCKIISISEILLVI